MTPSPDERLRERFLGGMSLAACTVSIVTTDGAAGRAGVTVSAMSSVSADTPRPTLLVCVHHKSRAAGAILGNGVFCVNVLRDDQSRISDAFAGRIPGLADRFGCARWSAFGTGSPRVDDPLVAFDCRVVSAERVGTHHVFIGEVEDIFAERRGSPLIYANRAYGTAARVEPAPGPDANSRGVADTLRLCCFHTFGPYVLPELLRRFCADGDVRVRLVEGDHRRLLESLRSGETDLALLYDLGLGDDVETEYLAELAPYVLLAEGSPLAAERELTPRRLAAEPMVLLDAPPSADYFVSIFTSAGLEPNIRFRSRSFEMVRGLAAHGLGYAVLATKPASNMSYDGKALVTRPLRSDTEPSRVVLARRRGEPDKPVAQRFGDLCRAHFLSVRPHAH